MIDKFLDGDKVYALIPFNLVSQKIINLSTSRNEDELAKVPNKDMYIVETKAPVNEVFLDFPLLNLQETQMLYTPEQEPEELSLLEQIARFFGL